VATLPKLRTINLSNTAPNAVAKMMEAFKPM